MSNNSTAEIFSHAAADFDQVGPRFFARSGLRLVELTNILPDSRVLDAGCGRGAVLFPVADKIGTQGRVFGVDLSDGMIRHTLLDVRHRGLENISLGRMDAAQLAFANESFDFVLCSHSIVFFPQALGEFWRMLKPGGKTALSIIGKGCFDWLLNIFTRYELSTTSDEESEIERLALDTSIGMETALEKAGFVKIQIHAETTDMLYPDEETWWKMLWTLGFRGALETMSPETQAQFKDDLFQGLQGFKQADGFHIPFDTLFSLGIRPNV